ncbi:hypothetical protein PQR53_38835, partial [Paraburkholderia fungorum]|uniref:hypothetical protein n=1 Tax=Paraburkholderia fungorum TaxID=134537 RepID=UPI0038BBCF17
MLPAALRAPTRISQNQLLRFARTASGAAARRGVPHIPCASASFDVRIHISPHCRDLSAAQRAAWHFPKQTHFPAPRRSQVNDPRTQTKLMVSQA